MGRLRGNNKQSSYRSSSSRNSFRWWVIVPYLAATCLPPGAACRRLHLQSESSFDPKRFFNGTWYETHRLNGTMQNWATCAIIDFSLQDGEVKIASSVYVPFLFMRKSFEASTKLDDAQNRPRFVISTTILSLNVAIISSDYDRYAFVYTSTKQKTSSSLTEIILIFRRNKDDKEHIEEIADAAQKNGIHYDHLMMQDC